MAITAPLPPVPQPRCDVVFDGSRVTINGTVIGNVVNIQVESDTTGFGSSRMVLEVVPTSITSGRIPDETVKALADEMSASSGSTDDVDVSRALKNARLRAQGIDPYARKQTPIKNIARPAP